MFSCSSSSSLWSLGMGSTGTGVLDGSWGWLRGGRGGGVSSSSCVSFNCRSMSSLCW